MNFDNIDFNTGDLILYHGKQNFISDIIEYFTHSIYSHVGIIIRDPQFTSPPLKGLYFLESGQSLQPDAENGRNKFGVQLVPLKETLQKSQKYADFYYRKLDCNRDDTFYEKLAEAHSMVHNDSYDTNIIDLFCAATHYKIGNEQRTDEFICSALVTYIYVKLELISDNTNWTTITPKDFGTEPNKYAIEIHNGKLYNPVFIKVS
jgi:hypothetical protein